MKFFQKLKNLVYTPVNVLNIEEIRKNTAKAFEKESAKALKKTFKQVDKAIRAATKAGFGSTSINFEHLPITLFNISHDSLLQTLRARYVKYDISLHYTWRTPHYTFKWYTNKNF